MLHDDFAKTSKNMASSYLIMIQSYICLSGEVNCQSTMVRDGQSGIGKAYSKSAGFLCFPTWATVQALVPARSSLCRWELQYRSVSWEKPMCLMGIRMRSCVRSPSVHPSDVPDPSDVRDPRGPRQSKSMGSRVAPCPGEKRARRSGTRAPDQVFMAPDPGAGARGAFSFGGSRARHRAGHFCMARFFHQPLAP